MDQTALTPQQEAIASELLLIGEDIPPADRTIAGRLRSTVASQLAALTADLPRGHRVWVSKHRLRYVYECEGQLKARDAEGWMGWNLSNVRGRVTHRALESLLISGYRRTPLDLAQSAVDHLADGADDLAKFLQGLSDGRRQDLIRDANNLLVRFVDDWPRVDDAWRPTVESRSRVSFGPATLDAVVDMALRIPSASGSRTFIVDFKTGMPDTQHAQDLRFYALAETLRSRVAPYRVASYYLDEGDYHCEDVDEALLHDAVERMVEGARRIIRLETGGEPSLEAGTYCRYCSELPNCAVGKEWTAAFGGGGSGGGGASGGRRPRLAVAPDPPVQEIA